MRSQERSIFLFFAALTLVAVAVIPALHGQNSNQAPTNKEEPTVIQEGVMTDKQKKHSKIFKGFSNAARGKKLRELAAERDEVEVVVQVGDVQAPRSSELHKYLNKYLKKVSCSADAIVIGSVVSKTSQLIEEGTFTFTDYELTVEEILKNNSLAPIQPFNAITITRSGGTVKLNGHVIRARDYRNEPLEVGRRYLVFLRFIPDTGAYQSLDSSLFEDSFQLSGDQITQVSEKPLPFGSRRTATMNPFINELRITINNPCDK